MMDRCENCGDEYERLLSEEDDRSSAAEDHSDERPLHLRQRPVDTGRRVAYGFGHVFNDITAAIWFSYTMVFMQNVVGVPGTTAGFLLFFGQTVDAIATPFVGLMVDKFGKKKNWVLLGTVMEAISFPLIYYVWNLSIVVAILIYICSILIFQMAWALVQISHLSLIPELTDLSLERGKLTSIRYVFTVSTNILMFIIAWLVFRGVRNNGNMGSLIGPNDSEKFQMLALIATTIGVFSAFIFHGLLKSPRITNTKLMYRQNRQINFDKILTFCKNVQLYQVAVVFTTCKLLINIALIYIPLFINESAIDESGTIASIPLVAYVSSLITSISVEYVKPCFKSDKVIFTIGSIISIFGSLLVFFNPNNELTYHYLCLAAVCFGSGSAITSVLSLSVTANLIGNDTDCGAFIYSSVTFSDKLINGLVIIGIEFMKCTDLEKCSHYYRDVLAFSSGSLALIGLLMFLTIPKILVKATKRSSSRIVI
ncbi:major facilitator superfamily domain-containing protein 12 [Acyrthosiphon pisum]|uniref:Major facilitator superfamily domain-containing protein 12-like n=1 Tax=Acyrthosiphon pisum TaxID=7029 RepID=A0A8R2B4Z1_ACYPI|nr:major facilitator superfamily domain-containing protein 12 [Acyrthosiphon pisum]XP_008181948.1 major facilitator superfamily domain-containing protein 12 [Acyrthosiphon pisum]XP_016659034.1 major facilitator superfamily domain-containing protein 12 [Acyrthosiphon pisum]|eukprot:XP_003243797.2 PREDICTED: major facilitator superfamily domain-containing protein 12 [Acyrthosiphon pisum]